MARTHKLESEQIAGAILRYQGGEKSHVIAASLGVVVSALSYHFRLAGVPVPSKTFSSAVCSHCGAAFSYNVQHARNAPRLFCSAQCKRDGYRGSMIYNWQPGVVVHKSSGYKFAHVPEGHISRTTGRRQRNDRAPEHVIIAEQALGRPLQKGEVVHHINCDKEDNRNENLLICRREYHAWLHGEMSRRWAQEHLA